MTQLKAATPAVPFTYVLPQQRDLPQEQQTKFECHTLSGRHRLVIHGKFTRGMTASNLDKWEPDGQTLCEVALEAFLVGFIKWHGAPIVDDEGHPRECPATAESALDFLDPDIAQVIGLEIWVRSKMRAGEKKV